MSGLTHRVGPNGDPPNHVAVRVHLLALIPNCHIPARAPTTSRARLHRSTILSALGPNHGLTVLFLGTHTRTSQWVTHHGIALTRTRLTSEFLRNPKPVSSQKVSIHSLGRCGISQSTPLRGPTSSSAHFRPTNFEPIILMSHCTASTRVFKKLKINIHRPVGTRVVFYEEGNTLPPLARLADTNNDSGPLDQIQGPTLRVARGSVREVAKHLVRNFAEGNKSSNGSAEIYKTNRWLFPECMGCLSYFVNHISYSCLCKKKFLKIKVDQIVYSINYATRKIEWVSYFVN
ncbi:hypothetical protein DVH24_020163 [Malus domestica]|uniref:Uncharacterized protein n=1 Tax=Malus domestica TaxID=3750 RepID=A0A498J6K7_MALDO|nr:hypothetical protein DVH24_020163 [Malus domestica]